MNKQEFLVRLRKGLSGLPKDDIEERLAFYGEIIDDRMEEGLSEEEAVCGIGSIDELISQITADIPLTKLVKEKVSPKKRRKAWETVLLVLGSPIWLSLLIAAFAVVFSLYAVLWAAILCLWAVFVSLSACAVGGVAAGNWFVCSGNTLTGTAMLGAAIVCAGLAIFMFCGCKAATKGAGFLTKKLAPWIRRCLTGKEIAE